MLLQFHLNLSDKTIQQLSRIIITTDFLQLLKTGKMQSDAGVTVDDEQIEVVEHFKYLGSLKSADGNCSKDTRLRIGMVQKRMLVPIWKDRSENETSTLAGVDSSHLWC